MNSKQLRILKAVFTDPISPSINWADVERLLRACGCELVEGNGSRVRFVYAKQVATFHRPHPDRHAKRYQIRDVREFLDKIGVRP